MLHIQEKIDTKINFIAIKNIQKSFPEFDLDMNIASCNKLVQLESKIIKYDLKKKGADITMVFTVGLMIMSVF